MKLRSMVLIGVALVVTSACSTGPLPAGPGTASDTAANAFRLGVGDKIRITTFNEANLSGEFVVGSNGNIALPLAGEIPARGTTPSELQAAIQNRLEAGGFVRQARVSAEVIEYRPYYILGEVTKPGQYPYTVGLTIAKAVATAGGYTYRANQRRIYMTRDGGNEEVEVQVTAATPVGPGDTLRIGERYL